MINNSLNDARRKGIVENEVIFAFILHSSNALELLQLVFYSLQLYRNIKKRKRKNLINKFYEQAN